MIGKSARIRAESKPPTALLPAMAALALAASSLVSAAEPEEKGGLRKEGVGSVAKVLSPLAVEARSGLLEAEKRSPSPPALSKEEVDKALKPFREYNTTSDDFRRRLASGAGSIPAGVWKRLQGSGWRFGSARLVVDAAPWLAGRYPRGWPAGTTWENTDAVHLPGSRLLVISEKRINKQGKLVPAMRVEEVVRHEIGHAFDAACGGSDGNRSSSSAFLIAYQRDLSLMEAADRDRLAYYLQNQQAGRQETFAEAFAELHGGGSSPDRADAFRRAFPRVFAEVKAAIEECK